ncbi:MAG: hypothetical protein DI533_00940 [Cereibacter sphaeroides]|uniref:Uncharacterized protein n=1 Tax=Cereibacter sphaeroides TaxID=1063 RepID=A0A2W5S8K0_CERSP|nr:MAG: hypothetical protein DI533_00940 [Cereibacter sphaeroides]
MTYIIAHPATDTNARPSRLRTFLMRLRAWIVADWNRTPPAQSLTELSRYKSHLFWDGMNVEDTRRMIDRLGR